MNDIVGDGEALVATCLRREDTTRLVLGFGVSGQQTFNLRLLVAVDDQYAIDVVSERGFGEQGHDDQLIITARRIGLLDRFLPDTWVQNGFKAPSRVIVGEYLLSHCSSVEYAILKHSVTESIADFGQRGLARKHDFTSYDVGVYDGYAQTREELGDRRFAARDSAGQTYSQRCVAFLAFGSYHLQEIIEVCVLDGFAV